MKKLRIKGLLSVVQRWFKASSYSTLVQTRLALSVVEGGFEPAIKQHVIIAVLLGLPLLLFIYPELCRRTFYFSLPVSAGTGINEEINVQGKLVDSDGTNATASCISGDTCDFRFTIYDDPTGGSNLWQETQSNIVVTDGIFNVRLGDTTTLDDVDLQNFNRDDLWVLVEFDPDGDGDFAEGESFSPRVHLASVPYAFNAKYVGGQAGTSYLRSDASDNYTSGTLTLDAGTTIDVNGDINIADTDITLDGANTTFTQSSGDIKLAATDDLIFDDAQVTDIQLSDVDATLPNSNTGMVDAINDAWNAAIGGSSGLWFDGGDYAYLNTGLASNIQTAEDSWLGIASGAERIIFDGDGGDISIMGADVGIGTTGPTTTLSVSGNGYFSSTLTTDGVLETNTTLRFNTSGTGYIQRTGGGGDYPLIFQLYNGVSTVDVLTLRESGNVGIGTTSPTAYLHLKAGTASANTAPLKFTSGTNLTTPEAGAMEWDGTNLYVTQTSGPTRKTIAYTDSFDSTYLKLDTSNDPLTGSLEIDLASGDPTLTFDTQGADKFTMGVDDDDGDKFKISGGSALGSSDWVTIDSSGQVGIGTTAPGAKLHVLVGDGTLPSFSVDGLVIQNNNSTADQARLYLIGKNDGRSQINFGDDDDSEPANMIYDHSTNSFSFRVNAVSDKVVIDSNGNVGIGTTGPGYELDVAGSIRTNSTLFFASGTTNEYHLQYYQDRLTVTETGQAERFVIKDGGNVGIGTTNPGEELTVKGQGAIADDDAAADSDGTLYLGRNSSAWEYLMWDDSDDRFEFSDDVHGDSFLTGATLTLHDDYIRDTGNINLQADGDTDDYLYIDTTSDVPGLFWEGIAATDPGIYVSGTELGYRDETDSWVSFDSLAVSLWADGGDYLTPTSGESIQVGDEDWLGISASDERIIFDTAGDISFMGANVGIGTTGPGALLDINGTAQATTFTEGYITWSAASLNRAGATIEFQNAGASGSDVRLFGSTAYPVVFKGGSGYVGIGTTAPSRNLEVAGSAHGHGLILSNSSDDAGTYFSFIDHDTYRADFASFDSNYSDSSYAGSLSFFLRNGKDLIISTSSDASGGTIKMVVKNSGSVGIGTTSPTAGFELDVRDDISAAGMVNAISFYDSNGFNSLNTAGLCWDNSGESYIWDCSSAPGDLAEYYGTPLDSGPGDLVKIDETKHLMFKKSEHPYDKIIGIISTFPSGDVMGETIPQENNPQPIALEGRVPLKVSLENGPIHKGNPLTSSSTPGVAMRATRLGTIIGYALEDYNGNTQISKGVDAMERDLYKQIQGISYDSQRGVYQKQVKKEGDKPNLVEVTEEEVFKDYQSPVPPPPPGVGKILVFVEPSYYNPNMVIDDNGNVVLKDEAGNQLLSLGSDTSHLNSSNLIISGDIEFKNARVLEELLTTSLLVEEDATFNGALIIHGDVTMHAGLEVLGHITVGEDTAGEAEIPAGETEATVTFTQPYNEIPKVTVTPQNKAGTFHVTEKTEEGFKIVLDEPQPEAVIFDWFVVEREESTSTGI